jgi:hypothetical protein
MMAIRSELPLRECAHDRLCQGAHTNHCNIERLQGNQPHKKTLCYAKTVSRRWAKRSDFENGARKQKGRA